MATTTGTKPKTATTSTAALNACPKFSGNGDIDPRVWRLTFEHVATMQKWDANAKALHLPLFLVGDALAFYWSLKADVAQDFAKAIAAVEAAYGTSTDSLAAHERLRQRVRLPGETVRAYARAILRLASEAKQENSDALKSAFLQGLATDLRRHVAVAAAAPRSTTLSYEDLVETAARLEEVGMSNRLTLVAAIDEPQPPAPLPTPLDAVTSRLDAVVATLAHVSAALSHNQGGRREQGPSPSDQPPRRDDASNANNGKVCNYCHKLGHFARECYSRIRAEALREAKRSLGGRIDDREDRDDQDRPVKRFQGSPLSKN